MTALHCIPANYPHELRRTKTAQCGGSEAQPRLGARDGGGDTSLCISSSPPLPLPPPLPSLTSTSSASGGEHGHSAGRGRSERTLRRKEVRGSGMDDSGGGWGGLGGGATGGSGNSLVAIGIETPDNLLSTEVLQASCLLSKSPLWLASESLCAMHTYSLDEQQCSPS